MILIALSPARMRPEYREMFEAEAHGRKLLISTEPKEIEQFLDKIEIGIGNVPVSLLQSMPNLKWLQIWSAGADFLQRLPELKELPFQLTTASGVHKHQIAEHVFAMLLSWNRCLPAALEAQKKHQWLRINEQQLGSLKNKTMLILGYGNIGESVARIAAAFDMQVIGMRRNISKSKAQTGVKLEDASKLKDFLPTADYVVNILPFTPETRHCFGAAEFDVMKNSALYINVGRGITTDEAALIDALNTKRIAGALLDVTETEPLAENSALWDMDNVMITAHYAGADTDYSRMAMEIFVENLRRYNRGEVLINLVDKIRGY